MKTQRGIALLGVLDREVIEHPSFGWIVFLKLDDSIVTDRTLKRIWNDALPLIVPPKTLADVKRILGRKVQATVAIETVCGWGESLCAARFHLVSLCVAGSATA